MDVYFLLMSAILSQWVECTLQDYPFNVEVDPVPVTEVDARFLSVAIDSAAMKNGFKTTNFDSPRFETLSNGLDQNQLGAFVYLRLGGSNADDLVFVQTKASDSNQTRFLPTTHHSKIYTYNFTTFEKLYRFASNMNWRLVFDLNSLIRNEDGTWNPHNAVELITAMSSRNYSMDYELGNEPDLYPTHRNITVPPEQLAKDFKTLKKILLTLTRGRSRLFGPDMATLGRYGYFGKFLSHVEQGVLDAITFHHYYSASTNVTVHNFTAVAYLDSFLRYGFIALGIVNKSVTGFPHPPIWIGETSSTYGGGNPDIGESFAAGFLWLDKLGLAAQLNISTVVRQTLKGGSYSLINKDYNPCPDYWLTLLYKELVGTKVLRVTGFLEFNRTVRVYGHCVNKENTRSYSAHNTIVLLALNLKATEHVEMKLSGALGSQEIDAFLFTPATGRLDSKLVEINGQVMKMPDDYHLPDIPPVVMKQPIRMPPLSYGFFVVRNANNIDC